MARKAKQSKWNKAKASKQQSVRKTAASREKRLANKHKREAIQTQHGDVQIVIKDGIPYMNGDRLELIDGIYTVVPTAIPEDVHTAAEILESYEDCHRNTCEHGNALNSNCSDCDEETFERLEDKYKIITHNDPAKARKKTLTEVTCELPKDNASKSRFERLVDKLRRN